MLLEMSSDPRYLSIRSRIEKLANAQIQKYLDYDGVVCYDTYNYRAEDGSFCPLSVMLSIPERLKQENIVPNQEIVLNILKENEAFGSVQGVAGKFYRQNREGDLKRLCRQILEERRSLSAGSIHE